MAGVAAIHYPLGDVDSGTGDIYSMVDIADFADWAAVNSHTDEDRFRLIFECTGDLKRTADGRLGTIAEDESHAITCGDAYQPMFLFRNAKLFGILNDLV
jgi:hypothetical protein